MLKKKISSTPLPHIQWSQKESTSIRDKFQSILANTNVWISSKGIQLKPFSSSSDDGTVGPVGKRSKIITKNKQDSATPSKAPRLKFIVGTNKGKAQGEPSASNIHEVQEPKIQDKKLEGEHPVTETIDIDQLENDQEADREHDEYDEEGLPQENKSHMTLP